MEMEMEMDDGASRTGQERPTTERASARDHRAQAEQPPAPNAPEPAESSRFAGVTAAHCEHMVDYATSREPFVKFMVQKLAEAGCTVGADFIKIRHCDAEVGGGFRAPDGVIVCYNHLASQEEVTHALTHELIHAYDHCRWVLTSSDDALVALPTALTRTTRDVRPSVRPFVRSLARSFALRRGKDLDWTNCQHHACSEIRAASLSGDCNFKMELLRGHYSIARQHQACVKRRALLSVKMNPYCQGRGVAEDAVERAFETCFRDTSPFDRRP